VRFAASYIVGDAYPPAALTMANRKPGSAEKFAHRICFPGRDIVTSKLPPFNLIWNMFLVFISFVPAACSAQGFQPVSPDELTMGAEPRAPGAPAVILFRQVNRDDNASTPHEDDYIRLKVLTEDGRKYANVEITFDKDDEKIVNLHARTIQPNGAISEFSGQTFDRTVAKARDLRLFAKTFTLPDVHVGSIVEYYYTINLNQRFLWSSRSVLNADLYTRRARFTLKPYKAHYGQMSLRRSWQGLRPGTEPLENPNHEFTMDVEDIPPLVYEDFMPPVVEVEGRVDFIYENRYFERDPDDYWRHVGKDWNEGLEDFLGKRKPMEEAVASIVSPSDTPEVKLRKIYDRVQQFRNTGYELAKTTQEEKRATDKPADNVEQVWKHGYGHGVQLTWLFLALVRAAGFDAQGVWVASRRDYFFVPKTMQERKLQANVVRVKLNGKDLYFDPGAAFTPYGLLTWTETSTAGLCLDKDGGTWIRTPLPPSSESRIEHRANLTLGDGGALQGKVTVTYTGLEAMYRRREELHADEVERKRYLEESLRAEIPLSAEVELTGKPDWDSPTKALVAEFTVNIPGWALKAGRRTALPAAVFCENEHRVFEHADRVHPIYFQFPYAKNDDVSIELPEHWQAGTLPPPQRQTAPYLEYSLGVENRQNTLHLTRKFSVDIFLLPRQSYPAVRDFFRAARSGDEQQILIDVPASDAAPADVPAHNPASSR
jgi:hypothetical protein